MIKPPIATAHGMLQPGWVRKCLMLIHRLSTKLADVPTIGPVHLGVIRESRASLTAKLYQALHSGVTTVTTVSASQPSQWPSTRAMTR
jgi:hypothetical protein